MTFLDRPAQDGSEWFDPDQAVRSPGGAAVTTYVSLFLLLFVFFIVVFSIAQVQHDRSRAVLSGLDAAFGRLPSALGLLNLPKQAPEIPTPAVEGFARDTGILLTQFGAFAVDTKAVGDHVVLAVDLSVDGLFLPQSARLRPAADALIDRLAVLLQRQDGGQRYRLVWHILQPADLPREGREARLAIARGAALAAALYAEGCPGDGVALSIDRSADGAAHPAIRWDFTQIVDGQG
jgi:hypothetical protein